MILLKKLTYKSYWWVLHDAMCFNNISNDEMLNNWGIFPPDLAPPLPGPVVVLHEALITDNSSGRDGSNRTGKLG
jgi:hypothetical protein